MKEEGASCSTDPVARPIHPALDLISAVKSLHGLSSQELSRLIREAENNILQHIPDNGLNIQIDVEKLARHLALHLIAVILASEANAGLLKYLLSGFQLLHSLSDLASRNPKIEQILLDDVKVSEQLLDLVFYSLVILCTYSKVSNDMGLLHSTLVASSLYLLTVCISSQWHELAQVLLAYYKVDVLIDTAFAAVTADIKILRRNLSADHAHSQQEYGLKAEETLNHLCQQCEASLQFLQSLCQQKSFRERLVKNKELSSKGGVLLLAQAVMHLDVSPLVTLSSSIIAAVSRLKSKVLSILLNLCEAESLSYLDEVASTPASLDLAKSIALEVLNLLKKMFGTGFQQSVAPSDKIYPKGQLQLNAMRLADIFSDDSNFRSFITTHFTEVLTEIFSVAHGEFVSSWCSSDLPIREEDATLEYDPFAAAGWVLDLFPFSDQSNAMSIEPTFVPSHVPRLSYPHQRTSLLVKVLANLHCFVPDICKEEKDLFLNKFVQCLRKKVSETPEGFKSISDSQKAATVSRNLGSLLSHAESLIPAFLNEEDVQLLRVFITQLESLITPRARGENRVQEAQNLEACLPPQLREVAMDLNNRLNQLYSRVNGKGQSGEAGMKAEMTEQDKFIATDIEMKDIEKDTQNVETSGSDSSSSRSRHPTDQVGKVEKINCNGPGDGREDEVAEASQHEEKQQRKRKRTIMNEKQISLMEKALMDEPDMQRNKASLEFWAKELSVHGSEVTKSQLKNWLNNRKARIARAAKDGRTLSEGDNLDKHGGSLVLPPCDSPGSPVEDVGNLSAARENVQRVTGPAPSTCFTENSAAVSVASTETAKCMAGQYVVLVNDKAEEIGRGKVCQVSGKWYQRDLEELGTCVVDIIDLKVDRSAKLPYPSELTGTSFDQAERKFGFMRVLWQSSKLFVLPAR
ncbi:PREDICTED: nodulin homeobox [Nicotiana attenuata]|uniref:Nodulin homeobox n=1 Tax=Nicotiana attenuata TaxID=49451 RepID=A0A314KT92_NICAT|nr:PREDICTED: nodulin homeobox [Nicotiana attenuata]XP_019225559.1 PREDICTED: nodulin homeobox [Nicotiana attenuata]XP_019225560.1 PREDICTED: nodulin homeobox [Nicotiana attenuata]XP_019225561.1 PREDICTED: nodulin homeobox [Nicotiana attenuata]OIT32576.1 nodulin homeobox [Nicotiana attenuata]